jgi:hypothetical protein
MTLPTTQSIIINQWLNIKAEYRKVVGDEVREDAGLVGETRALE